MKQTITAMLFAICWGITANAQSSEILNIAERYKGENAVMQYNEAHLTIFFEHNKLTARSSYNENILLLNDLAPTLFNTGNIYHGAFHQLLEVDAYSIIPFKKGYRQEKATLLKSTNVVSENIFFDDSKVSVLAFPGLTRYASTSTRYTIGHTDLAFLPVFNFQCNVPIIESSYTITVPQTVRIRTVFKNLDTSLLQVTTEKHKNTITYTWRMQHVKRYKIYDNTPSGVEGVPRVITYITGYTDPVSGKNIDFLASVANLYKLFYSYTAKTNLQPDSLLEQKARLLVVNCSSDSCRAARIYKWVQDNIKYVAFEDSMGGFIPREAAVVYRKKYGDCKDMSSLLVTMCRAVGLNAYFSWIGTRDKPYSFYDIPLPLCTNHMICAWNNNEKWIFMDGTHPTISYGTPPSALQGKEAMIGINADSFTIIKVPELPASYSVSEDSTWISINSDDEVNGHVKTSYSGYPAWSLKNIMHYKNDTEKEKTIKSISSRGSNKYFQKSSSYEESDQQITFFSEFGIRDYIQHNDDEVFINLNLQKYNSNEKIDDPEQRIVPIENTYRSQQRQVICLTIPKNYEIAYLPENAAHSEPGLWSYRISYAIRGDLIYAVKEYSEDALYILPDMFQRHNQLVDELNKLYKETIILKKIPAK